MKVFQIVYFFGVKMSFSKILFFLFLAILFGVCFTISCSNDEEVSTNSGQADDDDDIDDDDDETEEPFIPADQPGPYNAGAVEFPVIDKDRNRILPTIVWYPTDAKYGKSMTYLFGLLWDDDAFKDAGIAGSGPFPLIVFSHGHTSINFQSFSLMTYLAGHGYIVAASNHIENTALTYFSSKNFAKSALDRPQDMSALIDTMLAKNKDEQSRFYGKIDEDKIGIIGHSFGGYTSIASLNPPLNVYGMIEKCEEIGEENWSGEWIFCHDVTESDLSYVEDCRPCKLGDDRIKVSIPMTPAFPYLIEPDGLGEIDIPVLVMGGEYDEITPPDTKVRLYFEGLSHPDTIYWELAKASHYTFSSACEISIARAFFECGENLIDTNVAHYHIQTATIAYLGIHLKNDERYRAYFEPEYLATAPEVTIETK